MTIAAVTMMLVTIFGPSSPMSQARWNTSLSMLTG
jgi:hypothetical protein